MNNDGNELEIPFTPSAANGGPANMWNSPRRAKPGDAGADLYCSEDTWVWPWRMSLLKTNTAVAIPCGYEVQIRPRSSSSRAGIHVCLGTYDAGYCGEIHVCVTRLIPWPRRVRRGDRIAQLVVAPVAAAIFVPVLQLPPGDRGDQGWGSTGR